MHAWEKALQRIQQAGDKIADTLVLADSKEEPDSRGMGSRGCRLHQQTFKEEASLEVGAQGDRGSHGTSLVQGH